MLRALRRFLAACTAVAVASCGGGGGSATPPPVGGGGSTPPPTQSLTIVGVDNASPTALTPIQIGTTGISTSGTVMVTFQGPGGFNVSTKAIRVASDGTVEAAVPLYFDATSGQTAPANFSLSVSQNGATSNSISISVADIPQQAAYGLPLGAITRAFSNMLIMQDGLQSGAVTALGLQRGNSVAVGAVQGDYSKLLLKNIAARNDADRLVAGVTNSIPAGTVNGVTIAYDKNALAFQDRVLGWYLASLVAAMNSSTGTLERRPLGFPRHRESIDPTTVVKTIATIGSIAGVVKATSDVADAGAHGKINDAVIAVAGGLAAAVAGAAVFGLVAPTAALTFGVAVTTASIWNHVYNEVVDLWDIAHASETGATAAQVQAAQQDVDSQINGALLDGVGLAIQSLDGTSLGKSVLSQIGSEVGQQGFVASADLINTTVQLVMSSEPDSDLSDVEAGANQIAADFTTSSPELFADIVGQANVSNSNGPGSPLNGLAGLQIDDNTSNTILGEGMADQGGSYDFVMPLEDTSADYSNLRIQAFDPIANTGLGFADVNLLGNAGPTITMPTISGTCTDTDASDPDADDPDCD